MKTLIVRFTVPVEVEVPDDFPVTRQEIERVGDWITNDYRDGRYPHSVEDMHHAAASLTESTVHRAIEYHYSQRMERQFGRERVCQMEYDLRSRLAARCIEKLGRNHLTDGGHVEVSVTAYPLSNQQRYSYSPHVVICRDDSSPDGAPGTHSLATRTVFAGREAA